MASANVENRGIDYSALLELTQKTGLYVACGTLFYVTGYRVMLNNKPDTEWKALFKTVHGVDLWTTIENMRSKQISRKKCAYCAGTCFKVTRAVCKYHVRFHVCRTPHLKCR